MPPKPKISREDILCQTYQIVIAQGASAISSRSVAQAVGCSVQPIYSHFPTMEDLRQETYLYACRQSAREVLSGRKSQDFITTLTGWMLDLAENRPNLFRFLYLSDAPDSVMRLPEAIVCSDSHTRMAREIAGSYGLSLEDGKDLLMRICLFLMGICATVCINQVDLEEKQVMALAGKTMTDMVNGCYRSCGAIKTSRLVLRPWTPSDASWLYQYASNEKVALAAGWTPHKSQEESLQVINQCYQVPGTYAIVPRDTGHPVGCVRLLIGRDAAMPDLPEDQGQIRFWIGEPFWGRGLTHEAVDALLDQGFRKKHLNVIWGICSPQNPSSLTVLKKSGFRTVDREQVQEQLVCMKVK